MSELQALVMDKSGKGAFGFVTASGLKDENLQLVAQPVTLVQIPTAFRWTGLQQRGWY